MIYIVHGDDTAKSRSLIINHQKKLENQNKIALDIKETSANTLYEKCSSSSLFGEAPLVVLDVTESGRMDLGEYVETLKKVVDSCTLIVYSAKTLPKTNAFLSSAQKVGAKVVENTSLTDANVFKFSDALYSKNRQQTYKELNKLLQAEYDPFYIFNMILYGLRSLSKVLWHAPSEIKFQPFQKSKLRSVLLGYSETKLRSLFNSFYDLEKKAKTGALSPETMLTLSIEKVLDSK